MRLCPTDFLPEVPIRGRVGFFPVKSEKEWHDLPLPLKCSTWSAQVKSIIFQATLPEYGINARIEVHPADAFKALFMTGHGGAGVLLYKLTGARLKDGTETRIPRFSDYDQVTGAARIIDAYGRLLGIQGGFEGHVPANCRKDALGQWRLKSPCINRKAGTITYSAL